METASRTDAGPLQSRSREREMSLPIHRHPKERPWRETARLLYSAGDPASRGRKARLRPTLQVWEEYDLSAGKVKRGLQGESDSVLPMG